MKVVIRDLENEFGREVLSKAIKISAILDMPSIDPSGHRYGDLKMRVFQSGEKLVGPDPVVMFFKGKDWWENLFITLDQVQSKASLIPYKTLHHLKPDEINLLLEKVRKYRLAFLTFWKSPEMTDSELIDLIDNIDKKGVQDLTC